MKELLVLLGKRVHELRAAKGWSQEEFAHICGVHRTYAGQIERGEKNISFGNLFKVAAALGVAASELLSGLEDGERVKSAGLKHKTARNETTDSQRRTLEIRRVMKRLGHQRTEMDRTILLLEELTGAKSRAQKDIPSSRRSTSRSK